ncbi:hypothetical protein [Lutimonas vermicola]|uniref:Uncharacterized protein n=1 Tax=Lutimonas vermicola TaxID=414288 RepID=A0ABU9L3D3_9FLAO
MKKAKTNLLLLITITLLFGSFTYSQNFIKTTNHLENNNFDLVMVEFMQPDSSIKYNKGFLNNSNKVRESLEKENMPPFKVELKGLGETDFIYSTGSDLYVIGRSYKYQNIVASFHIIKKTMMGGNFWFERGTEYEDPGGLITSSTFTSQFNLFSELYSDSGNLKLEFGSTSNKTFKLYDYNSGFQIKGRNTVESFSFEDGKTNSRSIAVIGKSHFSDKRFLFIKPQGQSFETKIDLTTDNPYIFYKSSHFEGATEKFETLVKSDINSERFSNWFRLAGYWVYNNTHYVAIRSESRIFYYIIKDNKIVKVLFDEFEGKYEKVYFLPEQGIFVNVSNLNINNNSISNHFRLQGFSILNNRLWSIEKKYFTQLNSICETNSKIIIGGASGDGGYLGFDNPYIEIIEAKSGKILNNHYISEKYASINNMLIINNSILITVGFSRDKSTRKAYGTSYLINDSLLSNGEFSNDLFR